MKHVTFADKAHLLDDEAANALVEYARALAIAETADAVTIRGIDDHGNEVDATFLLTATTNMLVESSTSEMRIEGNDEVIAEMKAATSRLLDAHPVQPEERTTDPSVRFGED